MDEKFCTYIVQTIEKPPSEIEIDPLFQQHTLGIKWNWRGHLFGFWGVVRDREDALINVATTFYRAVRRQRREDHWYWRVLYWIGDHIRRFVARPNPRVELEEAEQATQHF